MDGRQCLTGPGRSALLVQRLGEAGCRAQLPQSRALISRAGQTLLQQSPSDILIPGDMTGPQPHGLRFAPLLARELDQLRGAVEQDFAAACFPVLPRHLGDGEHQERQQHPVFGRIEFREARLHPLREMLIPPLAQLCPTLKDGAFPLANERLVPAVEQQQPL